MNDVKQKFLPGVFLSAVTAYGENWKAVVITDKVAADGTLQWQPGKGTWQLYALWVKQGKWLKVKLPKNYTGENIKKIGR